MAQHRITTPEQVHFHHETAGLWSRAVAWVVDQLVLLLFRIIAVWAILKGGAGASGFAVAGVLFVFFALEVGYYIGFELWWNGSSPGKRLFKLRVISARGGRLQPTDVIIRNLLRPVDLLPWGNLLGGVVAFFDPLSRRLGDMASETLVIREATRSIPEAIKKHRGRDNSYLADPAIAGRILARVTREERDTVWDLVLRRDGLDVDVREDLFARAAQLLRDRYSLPEDQHLSDEQTVLNVALVIQTARV